MYQIEVDKVAIYQQPSIDSKVIHSLYTVENIQLLQIHNKWAKIQFVSDGEEVEGWVAKAHLKLQQDQALEETVIAQEKQVSSESETFDLTKFNAKAINGDIYCNRSKDKKKVNGCVINIGIEIKAARKASLAEVACQANIDTLSVDGEKKQRIENKVLRTPLKKGEGAAQMQLAVIPLANQLVQSIELKAYDCQLKALL